MGVAHHSAYLPWFEIGRTELLRAAGVTYAQMEAAGIFLVVARIEVRYRAPARYDDHLVLITRIVGGGRARIDHEYELRLDASDSRDISAPLATAASTIACVDETGRVAPLPDWLVIDASG